MEDVYSSESNNTGIKPRGFKILVEIPKVKESRGGLLLPSQYLRKEMTQSVFSKVLEVGHLCFQDESGNPIEPYCKPGDFIAMAQYGGTVIPPIRPEDRGRELRLISQESVDGVLSVIPDFYEEAGS